MLAPAGLLWEASMLSPGYWRESKFFESKVAHVLIAIYNKSGWRPPRSLVNERT